MHQETTSKMLCIWSQSLPRHAAVICGYAHNNFIFIEKYTCFLFIKLCFSPFVVSATTCANKLCHLCNTEAHKIQCCSVSSLHRWFFAGTDGQSAYKDVENDNNFGSSVSALITQLQASPCWLISLRPHHIASSSIDCPKQHHHHHHVAYLGCLPQL